MERIIELSGELLLQVKKQEATSEYVKRLAEVSMDNLQIQLSDDAAKKTFWINIYNAYYQLLAQDHASSKGSIYKRKEIVIASHAFSLDEVEHGILRRYRWKWSKGYLAHPFAPGIIRKLAVNAIDYRIHFALNCGAVSCPPIAFYQVARIDQQLDMATASFLESETVIESSSKVVTTSALLNWFAADFGGKKGALKVIGQVMNQDVSSYRLNYSPYNWEKQLANFGE